MEKKISVIVPVYNVESYLEKCVDSIVNQTYSNLEIILVDDGSSDRSGTICDNRAECDERIRVFHKLNGGLVSARKFGAAAATGDVIAFVDGDDWIAQDMYENMMLILNDNPELQLITSGLRYTWKDRCHDICDVLDEGKYCGKSIVNEILYKLTYDEKTYKQTILTSVCNKLFQADILKRAIHDIDDDVTLGEDCVLLCNFIAGIDNIYITHYIGYHYIQHDDSMIHKSSFHSFEKIFKLKTCFEKCMEKNGIRKRMQGQIDYYVKGFLDSVIYDIYDIKFLKPFFVFPFDYLTPDTRVILYGAGQVGYAYQKYIGYTGCVSLVGCADKDYLTKREYGEQVFSIEELIGQAFDYIIIAVEKENIALEIRQDLLDMGIADDKILWEAPKGRI